MQKCRLSRVRAKREKGIVVNRHLPEVRRRHAIDVREVAEKPAREIDEMHTLIDQLTAARLGWVRSPFCVVSGASSVSVSGTHKHQRSNRPFVHQRACPLQRGVIAMIETDVHKALCSTG